MLIASQAMSRRSRQGSIRTYFILALCGCWIGSTLVARTPAQSRQIAPQQSKSEQPENEIKNEIKNATGAPTSPSPAANVILGLPPAPENFSPSALPGTPPSTPPSTPAPTPQASEPLSPFEDSTDSEFLPTEPPTVIIPPPAAKPERTYRKGATRAESLRDIARRLKLPLPLPQARIVVIKSQRRLDLYNGSTLVKSYHVALGPNSTGHKRRQGDGRTPEGQYYICTRNASTSAFHIFLGLSYPALPDATRGINNKAISWREYLLIRRRLAARGAPLWRTRLGGWIGIHGGSDGKIAQRKRRERGSPDWTAGCIAVTNREIEEIHAATRLGTLVLVRP